MTDHNKCSLSGKHKANCSSIVNNLFQLFYSNIQHLKEIIITNNWHHYFSLFSESDLIPGLATFIACLILPLEIGIIIGIGLNLMSILYHAARPKISIEISKVSQQESWHNLHLHLTDTVTSKK